MDIGEGFPESCGRGFADITLDCDSSHNSCGCHSLSRLAVHIRETNVRCSRRSFVAQRSILADHHPAAPENGPRRHCFRVASHTSRPRIDDDCLSNRERRGVHRDYVPARAAILDHAHRRDGPVSSVRDGWTVVTQTPRIVKQDQFLSLLLLLGAFLGGFSFLPTLAQRSSRDSLVKRESERLVLYSYLSKKT